MRILAIGMAVAAATFASGCMNEGYGAESSSYDDYRRYDWNQPDPRYRGYEADRYYRESRHYRERRLSSNDRIYRGRDGRYYCRRPDGTTGLIVGGVAGGVLGNLIAPGGSQTIGTLLGAAAGAAAGRAIERDRIICR